MELQLRNIIPFIILFQCILFSIVLLSHKGKKRTSNILLASFLLLLALQFGLILLRDLFAMEWLIDAMNVFGFSYGPLLYLYARSLIYEDFRFRAQDILHFAPAVLTIGILLAGYTFRPYLQVTMYVFIVSYMCASLYFIFRYRSILKNTRAITSEADLNWLVWILVSFTVIVCFDIVEYVFVEIKVAMGITLVHVMVWLMVNWIFYKGLKQPQLFQGITAREETLSGQIEQGGPHPGPPDPEAEHEIKRLLDYMERERPYLDTGISLSALAETLDLSERHLSQIINQHLGKNFSTFVNDYRIDLAKERFEHPEDDRETVLEVMYAVGFNSKSSFNTLFKNHTGLTPTEYKKQYS